MSRGRASRAAGRALRLAMLGLVVASLAGCLRGSTSRRPPIHLNPNMDDQPKYKAQAESEFFANGATMRHPVAGTVAREDPLDADELLSGKTADGGWVTASPVPVDAALLARGEERYGIYCQPCHGAHADGNGMLHQRAGVKVANLLEPRLVGMADGYLFNVVTNGFGLMPSYAYPIPPRDRWAIIAYVRRLEQRAATATETAAAPAAADTRSGR